MEIGTRIRMLRKAKGIRQEDFAEALGVSVQTVSRWENGINDPDIVMLPVLCAYFHVSSDFLLGLERNDSMAKLLKTVETFELASREEAEKMVAKFKGEPFPVLREHKIKESEGKTILEVTKEFNVDVNNMKFE